jgi:hypothetical protein
MLKTHLSEILADASDFLRAWALVDGTECVVAVAGRFLELRVVDDDTILRSARFTEVQPALDTAQLWRIEWEIGCRCRCCGHPWKTPGARDRSGN